MDRLPRAAVAAGGASLAARGGGELENAFGGTLPEGRTAEETPVTVEDEALPAGCGGEPKDAGTGGGEATFG
jgi:hypothetical protein